MPATRRVFLMKVAATALVSAGPFKSRSQQVRELTTAEQIGQETMGSATGQMWEQWIGASFKTTWQGMKVGTLVLESVQTSTFPAAQMRKSQSQLSPAVPVMPVVPARPVAPGMAEPGLVKETESTTLLFKTDGKPFIQEVYTLKHDWLGTFDLLLVPGSPAKIGSEYTAVITRLTGRMVPMK